jgi:allantoate deiminase
MLDLNALTSEALYRCNEIAEHTEEPGKITRTFLREPIRAAHETISGWMRDAGMSPRGDPAGNLIGHYSGLDENAPTLLIGSHLDTVPNGGKYDGLLGVLLGIAAVKALQQSQTSLPFAIDVIGFAEEEGVRFGAPFLGSKAIAGKFDPGLFNLLDADGISMADAFRAFGLDPERIHEAAYQAGSVLGYIEVHIEQGTVLESADASVGVVEAIAGQSRVWLAVHGRSGHAGTTPMEHRRDALTAAAELVLEVERLGREVSGLRATVGAIVAEPGATNVIPGDVRLSLDVRHGTDAVRREALVDLLGHAGTICLHRGLRCEIEANDDYPAVPADPRLTTLLAETVAEAGHQPLRLVSGAGHDAMVMASIAPMAMLFLRSPGGISHHPDESVRLVDVQAALQVLIEFLHRLANVHL